jgi:uncharacterized protein YdeI (YjbR/CyaY-like superfamily)
MASPEPVFFRDQSEFREWLREHHTSESELLVGFYKTGSGKQNMTWSQSVDQALCFGWIDGIRRSLDKDSYSIRFTPRIPSSNWSNINIKKVLELTEKGLMTHKGLEAFEKRKDLKSGIYSFENKLSSLSSNLDNQFRKEEKAWEFFSNQAPSYKKTVIHWIMSAKRELTQLERLNKTITFCKQQKRLF